MKNINLISTYTEIESTYRIAYVYGPMKWSDLTIETKQTFYDFYDKHCPKTINISRSKLIVEGQFNDGRVASINNIAEYWEKYIDLQPGSFKWDIAGIMTFLKEFESSNYKHCGINAVYPRSCEQFLDLINMYGVDLVKNKNVLVVGSITPWVEVIMMSFGANVTSTDYNVPILYNPNNIQYNQEVNFKLTTISLQKLQESNQKFDVIVSFSCLEHDGLGRYGDPINPNADFASMIEFYNLLKPSSIDKPTYLLLSLPIAERDFIIWNSHRFYSECRFRYLFKPQNNQTLFHLEYAFGYDETNRYLPPQLFHNGTVFSFDEANTDWKNQPLLLARKI